MTDLYDTDVLLWSKQQAALLRRLAAGGCLVLQHKRRKKGVSSDGPLEVVE